MKSESLCAFQQFALRNPELRPGAIVGRIAIRHDRVETVVTARQFDRHEYPLGMLLDAGAFERLRGKSRRRAIQHQRQTRSNANAVEATDQKVATRTRTIHVHPFTRHHQYSYPS